MKRGRGGGSSGCAVVLQDDTTDRVELPSGAPVVMGRRSFQSKTVRRDQRISRKQLVLQFDEKTGSVRVSPVSSAPNPAFRQDGGGAWLRVTGEASLYDGDLLKLVAEAPAVRVEISGRSVVYGKRPRAAPECLYGLQCARRDDASHVAKYAHSEPPPKPE